MTKRPEILKGEVREFIDWVQQDCYMRIYDQDEDGNITKDSELDEQLLFEMIPFYSQPFQPEMITEYFEGWEKNKGEKYCVMSITTNADISFTRNFPLKCEAGWVWKYESTSMLEYFELIPQTLSQFITNCIQAGIKLTWREL